MSTSDAAENAILNLILRATAYANIADNAASAPLTTLGVALATADPGDAGTMSTSETAYTGYVRPTIARSTGFGAASGGVCTLAANLDYPVGTAAPDTVTFCNFGFSAGGAVASIFSGAVSPSILTGNGIIPRLTTSTTITLT